MRYRPVALSGLLFCALCILTFEAKADVRDVVHDEATGTIVRSTSGECVRTRWMSGGDVCAATVAAAAPLLPAPETHYEEKKIVTLTREDRTIYFAFNKAVIAPDMRQRLDTIADAYKGDSTIKDARIVGYADRIGNTAYNEKLSEQRAETVRQYLVARGLINTQVADTRWMGKSDPVTNCPASLKRSDLVTCLQKDRRVEVEIDLTTAQQASR